MRRFAEWLRDLRRGYRDEDIPVARMKLDAMKCSAPGSFTAVTDRELNAMIGEGMQ